MKSRINIRLAMEEAEAAEAADAALAATGAPAPAPDGTPPADDKGAPLLNVDIEANLTDEQRAARDLALKTLPPEGTPPVDPANPNAPAGTPAPAPAPSGEAGAPAPAPAPEPSPAPAPAPAADEVPDEPAEPTDEPGEAVEVPEDGSDDVDSPATQEAIASSADEAQSVDEALAAVTTLEALSEVLTRSLKYSGLTPTGAQAVNSVVNNVSTRLSMENYVDALPAFESYDSLSARRVQTRLALEGIADRIGKIYEAVVSAYARAFRHIKIMMDSIAFTYKRNRNQIRALKIALLDAKRNEAKAGEFTNRRGLQGLSIKGVFSPVQSVSVMKDLIHGVRTVSLPAAGAALTMSSNIEQLNMTPAKVFPLGLAAVSTSDKFVSRYTSSKALPGDQQFIIDLPKGGLSHENLSAALLKVRATIGASGNLVPVSGHVMKKNEIAGFLQNLEGLNNELMSAWKAADKVQRVVVDQDDRLNGGRGAAVGAAAGLVLSGGNFAAAGLGSLAGQAISLSMRSQQDRDTLAAVRAISEAFLNVPTRALVMAASTVNAGIAYANNSIRQYA